MKKLILSFLIIFCATNSAIASVFSFDGVWNIYGAGSRQNIGDDPASGFINFDPILGTGIGDQIDGQQPWHGLLWSATDFTITQLTGDTYKVTYFWSGFGSGNFVNIWEIKPLGLDSFTVMTLDGDGDGIPGNAADNGSLPGFSMTFDGVLTAVPVPSSFYLFGSGLLGIIGISRRKKTT